MINTRSLTESLERKYNLNESFVEEWWEQTDEDPFEFAYEYGLDCEPIKNHMDGTLYRFTGSLQDIKRAKNDGYFYSISEGQDEGHSQDLDESLDEAQLNENPLLAAAARAAIPAAIDVASNAISSAIDAKLNDSDNLEEDFWNPTPWFRDLTNNYETWSGEEWNSWSQEERDAAVTKAVKHFLIDNELSEYEVEEFRRDLEDNNFHTEARILSELCGTINESLSDEDIYDNLAGKLFNAAERFFMYSSDKITYDEWIRACEKAFFALEDEGHTCDDSNSINEDITEENLHIYKDVVNYLVTELDNFEEQHPCNEVESKVPGYNGDWCSEEGYGDYIEKATTAKNNYARALADVYFENAE